MQEDLLRSAHLVAAVRPLQLRCRRQAAAKGPAPHCLDSERLPDESTVRRWRWRRLISLLIWLATLGWRSATADIFNAPTILAWDFPAAGRILRLEANSP